MNNAGYEGMFIFLLVTYETIALLVNFFCQRRVITPITEILGPLTHNKYGKIATWLFLGWFFDHFYQSGERDYIKKLELTISDG